MRARALVHFGVDPGGVAGKNLLHAVHALQQGGEVHRAQQPQRGKQRARRLAAVVGRAAVVFGQPPDHGGLQPRNQQLQLRAHERQRALEALQIRLHRRERKSVRAARAHKPHAAGGKDGGGLRLRLRRSRGSRRPQPVRALKIAERGASLAFGEVPVVQQPFRRAGLVRVRLPRVGAAQRAQRRLQPRAVALCPRRAPHGQGARVLLALRAKRAAVCLVFLFSAPHGGNSSGNF